MVTLTLSTKSSVSALRIHISQPTTTLLLEIGGFELHERGNIEIKVYFVKINYMQKYLPPLGSSRQGCLSSVLMCLIVW